MSIALSSGQHLSRTFTTPTDARKGRLELSCKRAATGGNGAVLLGGPNNQAFIAWGGPVTGGGSGTLCVNTGAPMFVSSGVVFPDTNWHSLVLWWDTTQATPSDRFGATVDGLALTWSTANWPAQNATLSNLGSANPHTLGCLTGYPQIDFVGSLAKIRFQDGSAAASGPLGNNGFVLGFCDAGHLGSDDGSGSACGFVGANAWSLVGSPAWSSDEPAGSSPPPPPPPSPPPPPTSTLPPLGIILWGQSLGGNSNGPGLHAMRNPSKCFNIDVGTGVMSPAVPPLPGPDGTGLTNFLPDLLDNTYEALQAQFASVVGASICIGGSSTAMWATGGSLFARVGAICAAMLANGVKQAVVIAVIGETDSSGSSSAAVIQANMQSTINAFKTSGLRCRFIVHRESYDINGSANGANVRAAQAALVNNIDVFAGPDIDQFQGANRLSGQDHLTELGNANVAYLDGALIAALYRAGNYAVWQL